MFTEPAVLRESARGTEALRLADEHFAARRIFLTGEVSAESMNSLLMSLIHLEEEAPGEPVTLFVNSPGGEVTSGLAVYDYLRGMRSPVTTVCTGTAASMGAILFLAGQERLMFSHSKLMIHDPAYGSAPAGEKPRQMEERLRDLRRTQQVLSGIIAERTGHPVSEIDEITQYDSWYPAGEAVAFGLATGIYGRD